MGNRLSKIYTRTGDNGSTGMADGSRVAKDDLLVQAIGEVDELNSQLAIVACHLPDSLLPAIRSIQNELFNIGGELTMGEQMPAETTMHPETVAQLEQWLDELNRNLPPLKEFILPGGGLAASHTHLARAICRRAERSLVALNKTRPLNVQLMAYINRLSDYLFVLAREAGRLAGEGEVFWQSRKNSE